MSTLIDVLDPIDTESSLTEWQIEEFRRCEEVVQSGLRQFFEVGHALMRIKELKLYRETHSTFEAYLRDRWDYSKAYGYELISAAEVVDNLSAIGGHPINERQVRPLTKLEKEEQLAAWHKAAMIAQQKNGGRITARIVEQAIEEVQKEAADKESGAEDNGETIQTTEDPEIGKLLDDLRKAVKSLEATARKLYKLSESDYLTRDDCKLLDDLARVLDNEMAGAVGEIRREILERWES